jgi:hypothetical protein
MHSFERENKRYFKRLQEKYEGKAQGQTRHNQRIAAISGGPYESSRLTLLIPLSACRGPRWHLDDYIFTYGESACLKDPDEAKVVREYVDECGIDAYLREQLTLPQLEVPLSFKERLVSQAF